MAKKILIGVVAVIVLFVLVGFLLPGNVHVERSVVVSASPSAVFPHLCDFQATQKWSPWAKRDENIQNEYTGTPCTVGHKNTWKSEKPDVGNGSQTIAAIEQDKKVETTLDFGEHGTANAQLILVPEGDGTKVTWGFDSDMGMNPIGRWMGLMMDKWIGPDYEEGLASLKAQVEKS